MPNEPASPSQRSTGLMLDPAGSRSHAQYVLADPSVADRRDARSPRIPAKQMALYRVDGLLRTSTSISGWYGDTVDRAARRLDAARLHARRAARAGAQRPQLFAGVDAAHRGLGHDAAPFVVRLPPTATKTIVVPLQPRGGVCHVRFAITPTRGRRLPALNDPRTLGVARVGIRVRSRAAG